MSRQARLAGELDCTCDPEVGDERVVVVDEHILGLDVAMQDIAGMRVVERIGDFAGDACHLARRHAAGARLDPLAQRVTLDVGRHVVRHAERVAGIEEGEDVRMLELAEVMDLAQEAFACGGVLDIEAERLDRDRAVVLDVASEVHAGHGAMSEGALGGIASAQGNLELFEDQVSHV